MKLYEVLSTVLPYEWTIIEPDMGEATFTVGEYDYSIMFNLYPTRRGDLPRHWDMEFAMRIQNKFGDVIYKNDITKTGHSFEVMSTIKAVSTEWFKNHPTNCITMSAAITSRKKLYIRMLKQILPAWNITLDGNNIIARNPE